MNTFKQYITIDQASRYSHLSASTIRKYIKDKCLTQITKEKLIDADELDLLIRFKNKIGNVSNAGTYINWMQQWIELRDSIICDLRIIPTFVDTERQNVDYKLYKSKSGEVIQASLVKVPFRIITKEIAERIETDSYLIKNNKSELSVESKIQFSHSHELIEYNEQDIIRYILDHPDFKDNLEQLLINSDQLEIELVDEMINEE